MNEAHITRRSLDDRRRGETDWDRVDALTDAEIEAAVRDDPDALLLDAAWFRAAEVIVPDQPKERITMRVDRDVLDYFRQAGNGYQTRMNAVLKAYVLAQKLKRGRG